LRSLVRETWLRPGQLIAPLFVVNGRDERQPIASLRGHSRVTPDLALREAHRLAELGVGGVLLFGIPDEKDERGSGADDPRGPVPEALRLIRAEGLPLVLVADVCLCEYTSHGHCGVFSEVRSAAPSAEVRSAAPSAEVRSAAPSAEVRSAAPSGGERVDNDASLPRLASAAVAYAEAGADVVAPSAMMDGQVAALRSALDRARALDVAIMAYASKHASSFYGPFREAAGSTPSFGDRKSYQMDPANAREAMREMELDAAEGADILMVKPAISSLDLLARASTRFDLPLAAYQVSGEAAMIEAAAERGWIDRQGAVLESLTAIARAGAGIVITYFAADVAAWLRE
jgi:porphobilinogen synthase